MWTTAKKEGGTSEVSVAGPSTWVSDAGNLVQNPELHVSSSSAMPCKVRRQMRYRCTQHCTDFKHISAVPKSHSSLWKLWTLYLDCTRTVIALRRRGWQDLMCNREQFLCDWLKSGMRILLSFKFVTIFMGKTLFYPLYQILLSDFHVMSLSFANFFAETLLYYVSIQRIALNSDPI